GYGMPPGPPSGNIFGASGDTSEGGVFFRFGYRTMYARGLRAGPISVLDPGTPVSIPVNGVVQQNLQDVDGANDIPPHPLTLSVPTPVSMAALQFTHTGLRPPAGAASFGNFDAVTGAKAMGPQFTVGYRDGPIALELTGFFMKFRNPVAFLSAA